MTDDATQGTPPLLPWGRTLLTAGLVALVLGLVLGNFPYLLIGGFLAAAALSARFADAPAVRVERHVDAREVRAGDVVGVRVHAAWTPRAPGALVLHDRVAAPFRLVDGVNVDAFDAAHGAGALAYDAASDGRGVQSVGPLHATVPDPLAASAARVIRVDDSADVVVEPASAGLTRVRTPGAKGVTLGPGGDVALKGLRTNDFRELRPYVRGDPMRSVNWRATARASTHDLNLVVNEYEVEARKAVWVFLDASVHTRAGSTLAPVFDALADGAHAVAAHFLARGHRVGFTLYGQHAAPRSLHADAGRTQERRIARLVTTAEPGADATPGLATAVQGTRGFLARDRPVTFIVTVLGRDAAVEQGVASVRALAASGRRPGPVIVLAWDPGEGNGAPEARVARVRARLQADALARRGVRVIAWGDGHPPLAAQLAKGVRA